ncbi:threonine/serine exporter family protein, partial [Acidisphaera rubrifaciens]|uniref:threonine/serine exporter family protein n=1 Tax=Acidisphaera rubrifaciens TaxID=50715 RepID=UPI000661FBA5
MLTTPEPAPLDEVAHLSLMVGRLLLANGADTAEVQALVERFAGAHGCEAQLMISYESLLLTVASGDRFRTKTGRRVPAMNVGLHIVRAVTRIVDDAVAGRATLAEARAALDAAEHHRPEYSRWVVVVALGLTAGSLARLFGGDWPAFA